jgi:FlaA1/EpsC-like NDP-sugar epimerase
MSRVEHFIDRQVMERLRLHGLTFLRDSLVVAGCYILAEFIRFEQTLPPRQVRPFLQTLPVVVGVFVICLYLFGVHRRIWQYAGSRDIRALVDAVVVGTLAVILFDLSLDSLAKPFSIGRPMPITVAATGGAFSLLALAAARLWPRLVQPRVRRQESWARVLVVGAGHGGNAVVADLLANPQWNQLPVCFIDDDESKQRRRIHNVPVVGTIEQLPAIAQTYEIDIIGVAIPSASTKQLDRILRLAHTTNCRIQVLPTWGEIMARETPLRLRDVNLNDLLDRPPKSDQSEFDRATDIIRDRVVLVTGAAGSIGSELCRQIALLGPRMLVVLDNNETGLFDLERGLIENGLRSPYRMVLGDITDMAKLERVFADVRPQVIFHAAAYKHVPILEAHPEEAIFVNVQGTLNLCSVAAESKVERFVFISTDKAVHPVNVLGFSKRLGELIIRTHADAPGVFCSVRFGNVIGSRGSALPEFVRQIDAGGPVLVTHPEAERYFMTIPEAVNLVIQASALANGGEIFMLDMGTPVRIDDLAKRIIRMKGLRVGADIEVVYTGLRPGEKLTEELVFAGERTRATANAAVFAVEEDTPADRDRLERWITVLDTLSLGEAKAMRDGLRSAALGDAVPQLRTVPAAG